MLKIIGYTPEGQPIPYLLVGTVWLYINLQNLDSLAPEIRSAFEAWRLSPKDENGDECDLNPQSANYFFREKQPELLPAPHITPEQLSGFRFALIQSPIYRAYVDAIAQTSPSLMAGLQDAVMAGNLDATKALWNTMANLVTPPFSLIQEMRSAASAHQIPFTFADNGEIA